MSQAETKRLTSYIDEEKGIDLNHNDVTKSYNDVTKSFIDLEDPATIKSSKGGNKVQWGVVLSGMYVMMLWGAFSRCYPVLYYPLMEDLQVSFEQVSTLSAWFFGAYAISGEYLSVKSKLPVCFFIAN